ncbi:hypothetical protein RN001_012507 [Aquatica leii]|uniref:G-protein coupled receptors family 1 profile domain-containing protein n=1 Tax=Aquatica leii TaxID=1421715 RepID=A0AAN7NYJ5_9COLE|nr:hypothetical protein RN001_012507 [Aquatica leii]
MDYEDHVFKETENTTAPFLEFEQPEPTQDFLDVVLTVFGIIGIAVNVLIIYVICYFRKLHTSTNIYLINWSIANIGAIVLTITCFQLYSALSGLPYAALCFYLSLVFALYFNSIFFMILLTMDWWFCAFWPAPLTKFREYTKAIIAVVWILSVVYFVTSATLFSVSADYLVFHYSLPVMFTILISLVMGLHTVRLIKKYKTAFEYHPVNLLYIPTGFVCCWFLSWVNVFVPYYSFVFSTFSDVILFVHPICNFVILVMHDEDFKTCLSKVLDFLPCKFFQRNENVDSVVIHSSAVNVRMGNEPGTYS